MEPKETENLQNRFADLHNRSVSKGIYTYSGFMYEYDAAAAYKAAPAADVRLYGGFPEAERVVVRFGNEHDIPYEEPFPIGILEVSPVNDKFSDDFSHRDFLGALMHLGIERDVIGDILIKRNTAWIFVLEKMSEFISRELTRVKHTTVSVRITDDLPDDAGPCRETALINVSSPRIDAVVAGFYRISRTRSMELFASGKVFVNGTECRSGDRELKENDSVTVRGSGKFFYKGIQKETRKKREVVLVEFSCFR